MEQVAVVSKFYIDSTGTKWLIWGDKTEAEMAEWVEGVYRQTREAELKAKLMIIGGLVVTVAVGYSVWQIKKNLPKWKADREKVDRAERLWEQERLLNMETEAIVINDYEQANRIPALKLVGYHIDFQKVTVNG